MGNRYDDRSILINDEDIYEQIIDEKHLKYIRHYGSPTFSYPKVRDIQKLTKVRHVWSTGDRFYKLAIQYYGAAQYWWVIAMFNQKPTEAHFKLGDIVYIPLPLQEVLRDLERE